jgi:hypothetical protein
MEPWNSIECNKGKGLPPSPRSRDEECVLKDSTLQLQLCILEKGGDVVRDLNLVISTYSERIHKKRFIIIFSF